MFSDAVSTFRAEGAAVIPACVSDEHALAMLAACGEAFDRPRPGVRRLLQRCPRLRAVLADSPVEGLIRAVASGAKIVRAILFDKTSETNWAVAWHQDATIAVRSRVDVPGFGPWAVKDGEHHCQPPIEILRRVFTVRIHLDNCGPESGPLRVLRGTHLRGFVEEHEMAGLVAVAGVVECCVERGGVVLTCPLAVHSSPRATRPGHRRVIHLDCCDASLTGGLEWGEA